MVSTNDYNVWTTQSELEGLVDIKTPLNGDLYSTL
jgi:hypothetical protein